MHTVIVADAKGLPLRVSCGYCHSEHNYRGGARIGVEVGGPKRAALLTDSTPGEGAINAQPTKPPG